MIVVNLPQFQADMMRKMKALDRFNDQVVAKTALDIKRLAMSNTPVRTGNLRDGWESNKTGKWEWEVKDKVEYGPYVEFGTVKMAGRFMLTKAVHVYGPVMMEKLKVATQKGLMA